MNEITLRKGTNKEKRVKVDHITIPDLYKIAQLPELDGYSMGGKSAKEMILECWHLAHDLKKAITEL